MKKAISYIHLFAGREYDSSNRPHCWADNMVEVYLRVGDSYYPYEVHMTFALGTGMACNESSDVVFCKSAAEVTRYLHDIRADFQHYEKQYNK